MAGFWHRFVDPRVSDHLIADEGEIVIDEVRRHPMAFVGPTAVMAGGVLIMVLAFVVPVQIALLPILVGLVVLGLGGYRMLSAHMDRFVITNMRVFRVRGIFSQHTATMPMSRILDISVHKPLIGRIFSYGHFVFESAAQDQGLRDIRYVARPDQRDLTIQRVIQRSGLRSSMQPLTEQRDDDHRDGDDRQRGSRRGRRSRRHDQEQVDFDLLDVEQDPTDGGSSRVVSADEDAAWLAGRGSASFVDPVHGRAIPAHDVSARDARPAQDNESEQWTQAWSVRDRSEHRRARQQVAASEVIGRDLRDWLPGSTRVTLTEEDAEPSPPRTSRDGEPPRADTSTDDERESGDEQADARPRDRS
jgi:hypothetical protein